MAHTDDAELQLRGVRRGSASGGSRNCVVCILAFSLILALVALIAVTALHTHTVALSDAGTAAAVRSPQKLCRTGDCYQLGALLLRNANFSADPCANFFEFACGAYKSRARHGRWQWFTKTTRQDMLLDMYAGVNQALLYPELRRSPLPPDAADWMPPLAAFYRSCLQQTEEPAAAPFRIPAHRSARGRWLDLGYALTGRATAELPRIEELVARLLLFQAPLLLHFDSFDNVLDEKGLVPYEMRLRLDPALCGPTVRLLVREVVKVSVEALLASEELQLQKSVQRVCVDLVRTNDRRALNQSDAAPPGEVVTPAQLIAAQPAGAAFSLARFFEALRTQVNLSRELGDKAARTLRLQVKSRDLGAVLSQFVQRHSAVDLNNLAVLHFLVHRVKFMGRRLKAAVKRYIPERAPALLDMSEFRVEANIEHYDRWHHCILLLSHTMPPLMTRAFVDEFLSPEQLRRVDGVINLVKASFIANLRKAAWIDPADLQQSMAKVEAIQLHVGYPPIYRDRRFLENVYADFNVSVRNFNWNLLRHSHYTAKWAIRELAEGRGELWSLIGIQPLAVQAYYVPEYNQIFLAAGILQPPILYADMPDQFLISGVGFVIGHEIGHAFDPYGHKTPFANTTFAWNISSSTEERYHDLLPCISASYENINDPLFNSSTRSNSSIGNDLADLVGLRAAVKAFTHLGQKSLKRLPGLPSLSPEETLLLHSVQIFCSSPTKRYYDKIYFPSHSPDFMRVIGAWRNTQYFAKTFGCKPGAFMNPKEKCRIF